MPIQQNRGTWLEQILADFDKKSTWLKESTKNLHRQEQKKGT